MARGSQKDLLSRLADAGEAAIRQLSDVPGADRFLGAANAMRDRVDELQKRVRGLEGLEQRVAELERKVDGLSTASSSVPARSTTSGPRTTETKSTGGAARKTGPS
ncbi:MAG: hypothetical protein ABR569_09620 [Gaiellaceae bacterium]